VKGREEEGEGTEAVGSGEAAIMERGIRMIK
jgi:hypothetical protein